MKYNDWLINKFGEWERKTGRRQSYSAFARYLGVKQSSLSQWLAGNYPPADDNLRKIANKLGFEIYDILGIARPDPLDEFQAWLESLAENDQAQALDRLEDVLRKRGWRRVS
jgi:transcriptional regulator with XRE-family HTH domain